MPHIDDHLDADLSLENLAEIACFSPHHLHRIYRGIAGETAGDTARRLRLHRAAGARSRRLRVASISTRDLMRSWSAPTASFMAIGSRQAARSPRTDPVSSIT
jgi:AraC family transcriptional regulator